jgi:hypothetical protein
VKRFVILPCLLLAACATTPPAPSQGFFENLSMLCGKSLPGRLVAGDASDVAFANADMRAHVRECSDKEIRIAFDVGEDRSRTWIISRVGDGLRLKHRHLLKDGSEDPVSQYGGDTVSTGTSTRQEFPADAFSKTMFVREGRQISTTNVWAFEIEPRTKLTYELARPGRLFRVEFDIARPSDR